MSTVARSVSLVAKLSFAGACMLATVAPAAPAAAAEPGAASAAALTGESATAPVVVEPAIQLAQATPQSQGKRAARPAPVPRACTSLNGVQRRICVECDGVQMFKRIGCQQRVFWNACKGKRLFEDPYCQAHQDQGPPRGEGG
ncbi:MAG: hypothetical protein H0X18_18155 [Geodermatophilaceae bacterium]|nr:hypothetical protein [Geodermatophilaceae bacterium]